MPAIRSKIFAWESTVTLKNYGSEYLPILLEYNFLIGTYDYYFIPGIFELDKSYKNYTSDKWYRLIEERSVSDQKDNYLLLYTNNSTHNKLIITDKKFYKVSSIRGDDGWGNPLIYWNVWVDRWNHPIHPYQNATFKFWITNLEISENDDIAIIMKKSSDLAHEPLCQSKKLLHKVKRGYDYTKGLKKG